MIFITPGNLQGLPHLHLAITDLLVLKIEKSKINKKQNFENEKKLFREIENNMNRIMHKNTKNNKVLESHEW